MWMVHVTWTKNCQAVLKEELLICQIYTLRETVKTAYIITFMKFIKGLAEKFAGKIWTAIQNFRERMSFHQRCWQTKRNAVDDFFQSSRNFWLCNQSCRRGVRKRLLSTTKEKTHRRDIVIDNFFLSTTKQNKTKYVYVCMWLYVKTVIDHKRSSARKSCP